MAKKEASKKKEVAKPKAAAKAKPEKKKETPAPAVAAEVSTEPSMIVNLNHKDLVVMDGFNFRGDMGDIEGLAQSIRNTGLLTPIKARLLRSGASKGKYGIIRGHRRHAAIASLTKKERDALIIPAQLEDEEDTAENYAIDMIVGNDGKKLTMLEEAEVVQFLMVGEDGPKLGRQVVADKIGKTDQHVADLETLITASKKLLKVVRKGELAATNLVTMIRDHNGDMAAVEGAFFKAQEKAGEGKKVTAKHVEKKASGKPTLGILKDLYAELQDLNPGTMGSRLWALGLAIQFLGGEITSKDFTKSFFKVLNQAPVEVEDEDPEEPEYEEEEEEDDNDDQD